MSFNLSNSVGLPTTTTQNGTWNNITTTPPGAQSNANEKFLIFVKIICVLVFILGLIGNSLVLFVFGSRWSKLKSCEVFMLSLAIADLIATVIVPVKMFLELLEHDFYPIGHVGCKIISTLTMTTVTVSSLTLLVICIDRFIIVKYPLRNKPESWQIGLTITGTWLISFGLSAIYLTDRIRLWDDLSDTSTHSVCRSFMPPVETSTHALIAFAVQIVVPLVLMTVLYTMITRILRKSARSDLFKHQQQREMTARLRRNRKATILFITLVAAYYIFVLPNNIFYLIYAHGGVTLTGNKLFTLYTLLHMILMLNSCVNPIIYSNLHTSFRRLTLKLFCSCVSIEFKNYQWGDNMRSILRSSTRTVRDSFQSSRSLLFSRRKSTDDENHNDCNNTESRKINRKISSEIHQGPIPLSNFEEFDHYAMKINDLRCNTFRESDENFFDDDVFELNNGYTNQRNGRTIYGNGHTKRFSRHSTIMTTIDGSPPESTELCNSPSPETTPDSVNVSGPFPDSLCNPEANEKRKIMQAFKQQQNVKEGC